MAAKDLAKEGESLPRGEAVEAVEFLLLLKDAL